MNLNSPRILAIDPGNKQSAFVVLHGGRIIDFGKQDNTAFRSVIGTNAARHDITHLAIEMIACYGMPVGAEVFETCLWIGKFLQFWEDNAQPQNETKARLVYRRDVKLHLCNSPRANDSNVRQALIDRFGGKEKAIGKKAAPGPLYGISGDVWAALGVAVTHGDRVDPMKEIA